MRRKQVTSPVNIIMVFADNKMGQTKIKDIHFRQFVPNHLMFDEGLAESTPLLWKFKRLHERAFRQRFNQITRINVNCYCHSMRTLTWGSDRNTQSLRVKIELFTSAPDQNRLICSVLDGDWTCHDQLETYQMDIQHILNTISTRDQHRNQMHGYRPWFSLPMRYDTGTLTFLKMIIAVSDILCPWVLIRLVTTPLPFGMIRSDTPFIPFPPFAHYRAYTTSCSTCFQMQNHFVQSETLKKQSDQEITTSRCHHCNAFHSRTKVVDIRTVRTAVTK